jgi:hypothetical protein
VISASGTKGNRACGGRLRRTVSLPSGVVGSVEGDRHDERSSCLHRHADRGPVQAVKYRERPIGSPRGGLFERSARCAGQTRARAAKPAAPFSRSSRSRTEALASTGSKSCLTTPNANSRSSSAPRPRSTRMPRASAIARDPVSTAVLPIPAAPSTTTKLPLPSRARSSAAARLSSSPSRSRSVEPVGRAQPLMPGTCLG